MQRISISVSLFCFLLGCGSFSQTSKLSSDENNNRTMSIVFNPGYAWTLSASTSESFASYLDTELASLQRSNPELYWPDLGTSDQTLRDVYLTAFVSTTETYRNRQFQCSFLKNVTEQLDRKTQLKLNSLTENGKVCVQADLPREKQVAWTSAMLMFFWEEPWIVVHAGAYWA